MILRIFILLLLVSCGSTELSNSVQKPEWMNSADKFCEPKGFLCASAQGKSLNQADLQAKSQLAAIFETKIESEVSSSKSLTSQSNALADFDLREQISKNVREKVSHLLTGVKIIERADNTNGFYALAGIDRIGTSKFLRDQIQKHDERLEYLWSSKKKTSYKRMLGHYYERESYNKKLSQLTAGVKSPVSLAQLDALRDMTLKSGGRILLALDSLDGKIADKIRSYMASLGYQLVLNTSRYDYKIVGEMKKKRENFKVKGFSKLNFSVSLRSFNPKGIEIGGVNIQRPGIGRSVEDAFSQAEPEISKYIENHLDELRLGE